MSTPTSPTPTTPQSQEKDKPVSGLQVKEGGAADPTSNNAKRKVPENEFHSLTGRGSVRKVESGDVVFVQDAKGELTPITQDAFESQFAKVKEDVLVKSKANGKTYEGHLTEEDGYIIHGVVGVEAYENKEKLQEIYEVK